MSYIIINILNKSMNENLNKQVLKINFNCVFDINYIIIIINYLNRYYGERKERLENIFLLTDSIAVKFEAS